MTQPVSSEENSNRYVIDAEDATEMARLLDQDKQMTGSMGGIFSERSENDLANIHRVLDLACGPGGWVNEVSNAFPTMNVIGVDLSDKMIGYARAYAEVRKLANASFKVMDVTKPLDFADESFDLVNARCIFAFMSPQGWASLLAECKRILRPGGVIRLTEGEWGVGTSPAYETYLGYFFKAMQLAGRSFSATGQHVGITPVLGHMLRDAGFEHIQKKAHVHDFSYGEEAHPGFTFDLTLLFKLLQPFITRTGVATQAQLDTLYEKVQQEMRSEEFCALAYYLTVWGEKPNNGS
ncbi:MAG TPA: methyltransferase domain-containing protein [Ktedonobacteraceae bacterium]|nr:methyltransferase domain-containing protein [Ktedonobacteraceae bacterium]